MKIGSIIDLSHRIDENTQVFPSDPVPCFEPAATIFRDGMNVLSLHLGSHSGTHVDSPCHFVEDGSSIDEMDLELFVGPAVLMDARGKEPRSRITVEDLHPYEDLLSEDVIAVVWTGWDGHYGTPQYYDHPFLDRRVAQLLLDSGVKTVAIDALSVDETVLESPHPEGYPVHKLLCGAGCIIAENLTGIGAVDFPDSILSLFPIKLGDSDGAPVRAVAMELLR